MKRRSAKGSRRRNNLRSTPASGVGARNDRGRERSGYEPRSTPASGVGASGGQGRIWLPTALHPGTRGGGQKGPRPLRGCYLSVGTGEGLATVVAGLSPS